MGKALALAIAGILTALLNELLADRLKAWIPWFTKRLLDLAVARLPDDQRERFAEEWASHLNDTSGDIRKVIFARGCVSAASEMASVLGYGNSTFDRMLNRSLVFLRQIWKRFNSLPSAVASLFFGEDSMLANRRLTPTILIPTLLMGLAGFLSSYVVTPKYTAESVILIEGQKVPEPMVKPVVLEDLTSRVSTLTNKILADNKLRPLVEKVAPGKSSTETGEMIDAIRQNMSVEAVPQLTKSNEEKPSASPFPGFTLKYTAQNAREAQSVCNELADLMVREYARQTDDALAGTAELLNREIEDAKRNLEALEDGPPNHMKAAKSMRPDRILSIDYDFARKHYQSLLEKKAEADSTVTMYNLALGDRMTPLTSADLPGAPDFPNRFVFAGIGLGSGMMLGVGLAVWVKLRGKSVRSAEPGSSRNTIF